MTFNILDIATTERGFLVVPRNRLPPENALRSALEEVACPVFGSLGAVVIMGYAGQPCHGLSDEKIIATTRELAQRQRQEQAEHERRRLEKRQTEMAQQRRDWELSELEREEARRRRQQNDPLFRVAVVEDRLDRLENLVKELATERKR